MLLLIMSACVGGTTNSHPYAGELEKAEGYDEEAPFDFKLPTSLPFEVDETYIRKMGEDESAGASTDRYVLIAGFQGNDSEADHLIVGVQNEGEVEDTQGLTEEQVTLSDGKEAQYFYDESSQVLLWDEDDLTYQVSVSMGDEYSVEELIDVADSFETY
ncbi:hypothetical protein [Alkalibacillus haloalkaliphilus]|uniref:hypothetical protein n=1 Tax=Alkalibacillus haloalkaliphilus TaxID=94136 RepID=UPI002936C026|nr:hypothetical protein [Alkalibacillus haloalkaliphilus]MDV2581400.1 hypothetical protein [Alkalibacillus haloalkaliphilus]